MRCAMTSVSVSELNSYPSRSSSARSSSWFSMMPLWTIAMPSREMCGCALRSLGTPCVAQRVWAIPRLPFAGSASSASSSLRTLPTVRMRLMRTGAVQDGDACGVVTPILEPAKPVDQYRDDVMVGDGAYDSTHERILACRLLSRVRSRGPGGPSRANGVAEATRTLIRIKCVRASCGAMESTAMATAPRVVDILSRPG